MTEKFSEDYHDYVIKDGNFIGAFEEMYQHIDDPWNIGDASQIEYDLILYLIKKYRIGYKKIKILDIGCGKGVFTWRFKLFRPAVEILAVDISPTAIAKAKEKCPLSGVTFSVLDIMKDYASLQKEYDLVIISQVVWYILPKLREIIEYILDHILKKDGYLLINQAFYLPGIQKYGNEIVSSVEDLIQVVGRNPIELIEVNRFTNAHNAIILFKS